MCRNSGNNISPSVLLPSLSGCVVLVLIKNTVQPHFQSTPFIRPIFIQLRQEQCDMKEPGIFAPDCEISAFPSILKLTQQPFCVTLKGSFDQKVLLLRIESGLYLVCRVLWFQNKPVLNRNEGCVYQCWL